MIDRKIVTPFIASQFPAFYREEGPNFVAFVEAYYEWMESTGQVINHARSLMEYTDVDETLEQFMVYFKNTYINTLPESILADKRLMIKHVLDLYRAKGTEKGYRLLFRMLFNEDIDFYVPGEHLMRSSAATWVIPRYIEVTTPIDLQQLVGKSIRSSGNGRATVESFFQKTINGKISYILYLSDVQGDFNFNEKVFCDDVPYSDDDAPIVFGSLSAISIINGGANYEVGDILNVAGEGGGGRAKVLSTRRENGRVTFRLVDGGYGYSANAVITVNPAHSNVTLEVSNTSNFSIGDTVLDISVTPESYGEIVEILPGTIILSSSNTGMFNDGDTLQNANNVLIAYNSNTGPFAANSVVRNSNNGARGVVKSVNSTVITLSSNTGPFANGDTIQNLSINTSNVTANVANVTVYQTTITANAIVQLFGSGATFKIGGLVDKQVFAINDDELAGMLAADMDYNNTGFLLNIENFAGGPIVDDEIVVGTANVIHIDVAYTTPGTIANGDTLSSSALGIGGLTAYRVDGPVLYITGTDADMTNANIVPGAILSSNSGVNVRVKSVYPKQTVTGNGQVIAATSNSDFLEVYNNADIGYYIPGMSLTGQTSGFTADVKLANSSVEPVNRLTDWDYFPAAGFGEENLDSTMLDLFRIVNLEIGRITYLSQINPGVGYSADPSVTIVEPLIYDLRIPDGRGKFWGLNANVTARAGVAEGVVTGVTISDSGYGYVNNEESVLVSNANPTAVTGITIVDLSGVGTGYFKDRKGFASDESFIQDSKYFQTFSYEIRASRMLATYEKFARELVHPTGIALYGRFYIGREMEDAGSLIANTQFFGESYKFNSNLDVASDFISFVGIEPVANGDMIQYINQPYDNVVPMNYGAFFQANTDVDNVADTISVANSEFIDGEVVLYTSIGGTPIGGLANGSYYYVVNANTSSLQLSATASGNSINISKGADENHYLQKRPHDSIGGLTNESVYYAVGANSSGTSLSLTTNGAVIALTPTSYEETHTLRKILK